MIFVFVSICLTVLSMTVFFNIETITVTGKTSYTDAQVLDAAKIKTGDNMLRLSKAGAEKRIAKALVNVENVNIRKVFPSDLIIELEPSIPSINIKHEGRYAILSQGGRVLAFEGKPEANLLVFSGFNAVEPQIGEVAISDDAVKSTLIYDFRDCVEELGFNGIGEVDISDRYNIKFDYEDRIEVELGSINEMRYKLKLAKTVIDDKISPRAQGTLNVTGEFASFLDKQGMERFEAGKAALAAAATTAQTDEISETDTSQTSVTE